MVKEVWKAIKGFENYYEISNKGNVRSLDRLLITKNGQIRFYKGKLLKLTPKGERKYFAIKLCGGFKKHRYVDVHKLVAEHFISNPEALPIVNHLDENKNNNWVENLEWTTYELNSNHRGCNRRRRKRIFQFTKEGKFLRSWSWAPEVMSDGFNPQMVRKACLNYITSYKGFTWSYSIKPSQIFRN